MNKYLLPNGMEDVLYPNASTKRQTINAILDAFCTAGYKEIAPPLIEFEDTLINEHFPAINSQTFRMMDTLTHKMLGIRADMTMQVARIAKSRLKNESLPLRLCYAGDVFRVKGEGLYKERQITQAGLELIGDDTATADVEVITTTVDTLRAIGMNDVCVDLNIPSLVEILLDELEIENRDDVRKTLNKKDVASIDNELLRKIVLLTGDADTALAKLSALSLPDKAKDLCANLKEIVSLLQARDISITIDISETRGFNYYTGVAFGIFSKSAKTEIGRGGRYGLCGDVSGVGVSLYVNEILRGLAVSA